MTTIPEMINRLNATPTIMAIELRKAMTASLILVEADARRYTPRDVGQLGGSITHHIDGPALNLEGHVGPSVNYGAPVEFGRRAGARMPPVAALIPWVERHWHVALVDQQRVLPGFESEVGSRATNRRFVPRTVSQGQIRRRAFLLARAIQRRGIRRRPYLAEAYNKNRTEIGEQFRRVGVAVSATLSGDRAL